jgi:hypothetical protein
MASARSSAAASLRTYPWAPRSNARRAHLAELGDHVEAGRRTEVDIEDHDVGVQPACGAHGLARICALADDLELVTVAEQPRHTGPDDRVVIDQQHSDHGATITHGRAGNP